MHGPNPQATVLDSVGTWCIKANADRANLLQEPEY